MTRYPDALRALSSRNFRLFFGGQLVSLIGTWMQTVALSWLVYRLTGAIALLGLVAFAAQAPVFLLGSLGGVLADRVDARRWLMVTQALQLAQAFLLAGLTWSGVVRPWQILALATALGVVTAFDLPLRQVLVAGAVDRDHLPNAIALNSSVFHGSRVLGPSLAGLMVAAVGEGWCFFANGLSFLAALAALARMDLPAPAARGGHPPVWEHFKEGVAFVRGNRQVAMLLALLGAVCLLGMPYTVLLPVFAKDILHGGPRTYGLLMAGSGVGAVVAAGWLATRKGHRGLERVAWLGAAGAGAALVAFAGSRSLPLSLALIVPLGASMVAHMTSNNTLVQILVPDALRGRVMAFHAMVFTIAMPIGALLEGMLAHRLGAPVTVALGGLGCVAGAAAFALKLRAVRRASAGQ